MGHKWVLYNICDVGVQQAEVLRKHTSLRVSQYCGALHVDYWEGHRWGKELKEQDVWVMTPQILLNSLRHGFFKVHNSFTIAAATWQV